MSHHAQIAHPVQGSTQHDCPLNVIVTITPPDFMKFSLWCCIECLASCPLDKIVQHFPGAMVSARVAPRTADPCACSPAAV